ncbi:MAG: hypothetical protein SGARI_007450, partial [Bacillariaceae sp.]
MPTMVAAKPPAKVEFTGSIDAEIRAVKALAKAHEATAFKHPTPARARAKEAAQLKIATSSVYTEISAALRTLIDPAHLLVPRNATKRMLFSPELHTYLMRAREPQLGIDTAQLGTMEDNEDSTTPTTANIPTERMASTHPIQQNVSFEESLEDSIVHDRQFGIRKAPELSDELSQTELKETITAYLDDQLCIERETITDNI